MRSSKITLSQRAVCAFALLVLCFGLAGCKALFGGHGGKNLTDPVTGLTATASSCQVTLNWNPYPGAYSYNVWRSTTITIPPSTGPITYLPLQKPPAGTTFTDTTVTNGTTYYYAVNANGSLGVSNFSNVVSATP
jgi:mannan endo-1,4-beta-mannosidase